MVRLCTIMMAAAAALGLSVPAAQAQTCRIAAGVAPDGSPAFIDVFEYDYVDEKPQFPGGDSKLVGFINARRRYPAEAYRRGIEGRVVCSFVVDAEGKLSHFKVLKGVECSLNREALRILAGMPRWEPGKIDGRCVPVRVIWAVPFRR